MPGWCHQCCAHISRHALTPPTLFCNGAAEGNAVIIFSESSTATERWDKYYFIDLHEASGLQHKNQLPICSGERRGIFSFLPCFASSCTGQQPVSTGECSGELFPVTKVSFPPRVPAVVWISHLISEHTGLPSAMCRLHLKQSKRLRILQAHLPG